MSHDGRTVVLVGVLAVFAAALATTVLVGGTVAVASDDASSEATLETNAVQSSTTAVSEPAAEMPVPEPGDEYYEAAAPDGSWISYINPQDEYRNPYLGDGSGKICVTLVNEAGEPVVGESVPNTTATVPTGDELEWHSSADPMVVEYSLTDNYDRPLDADQFGTNAELPQGDGYMDSHCIEMHGQPEDGTIEYGEVEIDGEHADDIEVAGYIQQAHEAWDSDVDPLEDAESYEEAGGSWTYKTDGSHGQAVVVLQLSGEVDDSSDEPEERTESTTENSTDSNESSEDDAGVADDDGADGDDATGDDSSDDATDDDGNGSDDADGLPGFGVGVAVAALAVAAVAVSRRP
ncbi:PGF-CTERM sorting domain-containing protein [Natronococcus sp. A-GB7]|uniref:PGF-CTERM sorting domain-containing protein n=1 Tax=Natronococcus sp. A-GB7 TaxID=3037649 RepID=UPI00241C619D|nr:PGF-CTERM sorting domain-containing protein [Natronococcus sp. A-GB7]MDG5820956.1 PGF-CTERM sorting domain-containing protein [Natronococcus sp. A-GB7]